MMPPRSLRSTERVDEKGSRDEREEGVSHSRKAATVGPQKLDGREFDSYMRAKRDALSLDHMSDVEYAYAVADMVVAGDCTNAAVRERHRVARKRDHLRPVLDMKIV